MKTLFFNAALVAMSALPFAGARSAVDHNSKPCGVARCAILFVVYENHTWAIREQIAGYYVGHPNVPRHAYYMTTWYETADQIVQSNIANGCTPEHHRVVCHR